MIQRWAASNEKEQTGKCQQPDISPFTVTIPSCQPGFNPYPLSPYLLFGAKQQKPGQTDIL